MIKKKVDQGLWFESAVQVPKNVGALEKAKNTIYFVFYEQNILAAHDSGGGNYGICYWRAANNRESAYSLEPG